MLADRIEGKWIDAFERVFGYTAAEVIGQHVQMINAPGDPDPAAVAMETWPCGFLACRASRQVKMWCSSSRRP